MHLQFSQLQEMHDTVSSFQSFLMHAMGLQMVDLLTFITSLANSSTMPSRRDDSQLAWCKLKQNVQLWAILQSLTEVAYLCTNLKDVELSACLEGLRLCQVAAFGKRSWEVYWCA